MLHEAVSQFTLVVLISTTETASLVPDPFPDEPSNIDTGRQLRPTECPEIHDVPVSRGHVEIPLEVVLSHKVDDHVHSLPIRRLKDFLGPVLRVVVEAGSSAEAFAEINLFLRPGRDVDG